MVSGDSVLLLFFFVYYYCYTIVHFVWADLYLTFISNGHWKQKKMRAEKSQNEQKHELMQKVLYNPHLANKIEKTTWKNPNM